MTKPKLGPHSSPGRKAAEQGEARRQAVLGWVAQGLSLDDAADKIAISRTTVRHWLKRFPNFYRDLREILEKDVNRSQYRLYNGTFQEFCKEIIGRPIPDHAKAWDEVLSDNSVRRVMILVPPNHAKTQLISIQRAAWMLACDRQTRQARISETQPFARKIVWGVKQILEDTVRYPALAELGDFKPPDFGIGSDNAWRQDHIYVAGCDAQLSHSPSLEAKGIDTQLYGDRFNEIVCDDLWSVKSDTPQMKAKGIRVVRQDAWSRLPKGHGRLIMVGTRVGDDDGYKELIADGFFSEVIKQPALNPDGTPIWRRSWLIEPNHDPRDLLDPKYVRKKAHDHEIEVTLGETRIAAGSRLWSLQYMQDDADDDTKTFPMHLLDEAKDNALRIRDVPELMSRAKMVTVAGLDPATTGFSVFVALGISLKPVEREVDDPQTGKLVKKNCYPTVVIDVVREREVGAFMKEFLIDNVRIYRPRRLYAEDKAFQAYAVTDRETVSQARQLGCVVQGHDVVPRNSRSPGATGKHDPDFGVGAMAEDFRYGLVQFPWGDQLSRARIAPLVSELNSWRKFDRRLVQDCVMAFWYAKLAGLREVNADRTRKPTSFYKLTGEDAPPAYQLAGSLLVPDEDDEEIPWG